MGGLIKDRVKVHLICVSERKRSHSISRTGFVFQPWKQNLEYVQPIDVLLHDLTLVTAETSSYIPPGYCGQENKDLMNDEHFQTHR